MTGFYESEASAPLTPHAIEDHTDVTIDSYQDGDILRYNALQARWENQELLLELALDELTDVSASAPNDAEVLTWSDAQSLWVPSPAGGGGGVTILSDLTDVVYVGLPAIGESLTFNGTVWENAPIGVASLDDIGDVDTTGVTNGAQLVYEGGVWVISPAGEILANPVIIGTGVDGTNAGLHLNAGSLATDYSELKFMTSGVDLFKIEHSNAISDLLNIYGPNGEVIINFASNLMTTHGSQAFLNQSDPSQYFLVAADADGLDNNLSFTGTELSNTVDFNIGSEGILRTDGVMFATAGLISQGGILNFGGDIVAGNNDVSSGLQPTQPAHLTRKDYVDGNFVDLTNAQTINGAKTFNDLVVTQSGLWTNGGIVNDGGNIAAGLHHVTSNIQPTDPQHLTRKDYVDNNFVDLVNNQTVNGAKTWNSVGHFNARANFYGNVRWYNKDTGVEFYTLKCEELFGGDSVLYFEPSNNNSGVSLWARSSGGADYVFNVGSGGDLAWRGNVIADGNGIVGPVDVAMCRVDLNGNFFGTASDRRGVSSVVHNGTGEYTVTFTDAAPSIHAQTLSVATWTILGVLCNAQPQSTTQWKINVYNTNGALANADLSITRHTIN